MAENRLHETFVEPALEHDRTVMRFPLTPREPSTPLLNRSALPPPEALRGMELTTQERYVAPFLSRTTWMVLFGVSLVALSALYGGHLYSHLLRFAWSDMGMLSVVVFTLAAGLYIEYTRGARLVRRLRFRRQNVFAVATVLLTFLAIGPGLNSRRLTTLLFGFAMLDVYDTFGHRLVEFYREYLYAHPRLQPDTRRAHAAAHPPQFPGPNMPLLLFVVAVAIFLPYLSMALTYVVLLGVLGRVALRRPRPAISLRRDLFPLYFLYRRWSAAAPGQWVPPSSVDAREAITHGLFMLPFLFLATSLSLFFPWDLFKPLFAWLIARGDRHPGLAEQLAPYWERFTTETWVLPTFVITYGASDTQHGAAFYLTFFVSAAFAVVFMFLLLGALYRKPLEELSAVAADLATLDHTRADGSPRTEWEWYVDRLVGSTHVARWQGQDFVEAEHLLLGVEPTYRFPLLLHESILAEHCYITGESGSGKTSLGLASLVAQLLRPRRRRGAGGVWRPAEESAPPPMVVLDLKGDRSFFHAVRAEVEARRWVEAGVEREQEFRFLTFELGLPSDRFDPFSSFDPSKRTIAQLTELLLNALDLNHGVGYGRSYYTGESRRALRHALAVLLERNTPERSTAVTFERLADALAELPGDDRKNAHELLGRVQSLASIPQLCVDARPADTQAAHRAIHMPTLLERRQVAYFYLPTILQSLTVREVGQLALQALLTAAQDREREGLPRRQAYLVIDEFQAIASNAFGPILQQARQKGVGLILANQTPRDLRLPDIDLQPAVNTNTRLKMYFAMSHRDDVQAMQLLSGEELAVLKQTTLQPMRFERWVPEDDKAVSTTGEGGTTETEDVMMETRTFQEVLRPRLGPNEIAEISDHPLSFIAHVTRGAGYTQFSGLPFHARTTWPVTLEEHQARERAPWPAPVPGQVVSNRDLRTIEAAAAADAEANRARAEAVRSRFQQEALALTTAAPSKPPRKKKPPPTRPPRREG